MQTHSNSTFRTIYGWFFSLFTSTSGIIIEKFSTTIGRKILLKPRAMFIILFERSYFIYASRQTLKLLKWPAETVTIPRISLWTAITLLIQYTPFHFIFFQLKKLNFTKIYFIHHESDSILESFLRLIEKKIFHEERSINITCIGLKACT